VRVLELAPGVAARVADTVTPQPVLAAVRFSTSELSSLSAGGLVLVLDDLRDPGNVGTAIRSAEAAGAGAVVLTGQSVDPLNPKALRASAGAAFFIPIVTASLDELFAWCARQGVATFATVVRGGSPYESVDLSGAAAVLIGNEATGLAPEVVARCVEVLSIPMTGRGESLNAGVAASLVAFEAQRQRAAGGPGAARSLGAP
jgi:TrmH family RNA methyltransferase